MDAQEYFDESEYSKIDFGSNPKLFSKKELLDFTEEFHKEKIIEMNTYLINNYAKTLRPYPPKEEKVSAP